VASARVPEQSAAHEQRHSLFNSGSKLGDPAASRTCLRGVDRGDRGGRRARRRHLGLYWGRPLGTRRPRLFALPSNGSTEVRVMTVRLNRIAFEYAKKLVSAGRFVFDVRDDWSEHRRERVHQSGTATPNTASGAWAYTMRRASRPRRGTSSPTAIRERPPLRPVGGGEACGPIQAFRRRECRSPSASHDRRDAPGRTSKALERAVLGRIGSGFPNQ
jgi:hypothetical protein